jgi:hypothetical protein
MKIEAANRLVATKLDRSSSKAERNQNEMNSIKTLLKNQEAILKREKDPTLRKKSQAKIDTLKQKLQELGAK